MTKNFFRITIAILAAALLALVWQLWPLVLSEKKTAAVQLQSGRAYSSEQPVVLKGVTSSNASLIVFFQDKVGFATADSQGNWSADLGNLPRGIYYVQVLSQESPKTESVLATDFSVADSRFLSDAINRFLAADISLSQQQPMPFFSIPEAAPVLQGTWKLVQ